MRRRDTLHTLRSRSSRHPRRAHVACETLEQRRLLAAGDLDPSFSDDGQATIAIAGVGNLNARNVAVQSGGKVIVVGDCSSGSLGGKMVLARFNPNGSLDTSFGGAGTGLASTDFPEFFLEDVHTNAVAIQPADDKIVVVGWGERGITGYMVVARFSANGVLDTSFSGDGKDVPDFDGSDHGSFGHAVAIQNDGKIVIAGSTINGDDLDNPNSEMVVARYLPNGKLDGSFDGDGTRRIDFGAHEGVDALTIDYTGSSATNPHYGKIILFGDRHFSSNVNNKDFALARLNTNGSLDTSFSGDGKLITPFVSEYSYSRAGGVAVQPGGKIVIGGEVGYQDFSTHNFGVMRFNANGSVDTTFGVSNGRTEFEFGGQDGVNDLVIGQSGAIIVTGFSQNRMAIACLTDAGILDPVFSGDGKQTISFGSGSFANARGVARAPGGTLVVAGGTSFATAKLFDRKATTITIRSFDPEASEAGPDSATFLVSRAGPVANPQRVYISTSGTATPPLVFQNPRDYNGNNITFGNGMISFTYVDIPAGDADILVTITPVDDTIVEGDETAIFSVAPNSSYDIGLQPSATLVIRDNDVTAGPSVTLAQFVYETAPQRVQFTFNQDVGASLSLSDFNVTGPPGMPGHALSYNAITNTATLSFSGILPDGNYSAEAVAAGITNAAGQSLTSTVRRHFFFVNADANRDRQVNLADFNILAANFGQPDRTFSQGDFNYDGIVNLQDFNILASRFGGVLQAVATLDQTGNRPPPARGDIRFDDRSEDKQELPELS